MEVGADEEVYMFKYVFQLKSVVIYRYTESLGYLNCKADRCIASGIYIAKEELTSRLFWLLKIFQEVLTGEY